MQFSWYFVKTDFIALIVFVVCYAYYSMDTSLSFKENKQKAPLLFLKGPVTNESVRYPYTPCIM